MPDLAANYAGGHGTVFVRSQSRYSCDKFMRFPSRYSFPFNKIRILFTICHLTFKAVSSTSSIFYFFSLLPLLNNNNDENNYSCYLPHQADRSKRWSSTYHWQQCAWYCLCGRSHSRSGACDGKRSNLRIEQWNRCCH